MEEKCIPECAYREKITELQAENKLLKRRVKAVESLGACYRLGARPTEKLFTELERTKRMLDKF